MRTNVLFLLTFLWSHFTHSQIEDAWIFFKDKPEVDTYLSNPIAMLSQRAIDRRNRLQISLDEKDVPIDVTYYNQINATTGITVKARSKWLNALHIRGTKETIAALLPAFDFIESIEYADKRLNRVAIDNSTKNKLINNHQNKFKALQTEFDYGVSSTQIKMLNADYLHREGYTGEGMHIAVIDGGFLNVETLPAFQRLRDQNKILGGYDFVNRSPNFYSAHSHGTHVLSNIAGYIENEFVGTAPDASFYLFITEDILNETPLEESLWVEAAERADSLGVDVINTSLGYTTFDNRNYSHTYNDLDGKTTFISRGAEIGASRGMLLVTSAGNSGSSAWKYLSAPADAAAVFTVGAVNASENMAQFSSYGPTADGRVKPDVVAHGENVYIINYNSGEPSRANGTSFSSPVMAGAVACFWQAFPNLKPVEVMEIVRKSSHRYANPTDHYGYGIPDFEQAFKGLGTANLTEKTTLKTYPNPVEDLLFIDYNEPNLKISIINPIGVVVKDKETVSNSIDMSDLSGGMYILQIEKEGLFQKIKFLKH
ncbi:S8 family serine peptidase [Tenacibaculum sp. C7A-26P2]|uniref:S8 family serine peptidase n=1 Tax=Tenacibaculum sp. C7A-26P2 TaxID=3447504 RepID=UPI003F835CE9